MVRRVRLEEKPKKRVRLMAEPRRTRVRLYNPLLNEDGNEPSLDLKARRVIMLAMLYYGLNISLVPDEVNDRWVRDLIKGYNKLDRARQWALGPVEGLNATTMHVKVTTAACSGAIAWLAAAGIPSDQFYINKDWNWSKRYRIRWLHPSNFHYLRE